MPRLPCAGGQRGRFPITPSDGLCLHYNAIWGMAGRCRGYGLQWTVCAGHAYSLKRNETACTFLQAQSKIVTEYSSERASARQVPDHAPAVAPQGLRDVKYAGSVDFVLDQQNTDFDVWQVRRRSTSTPELEVRSLRVSKVKQSVRGAAA